MLSIIGAWPRRTDKRPDRSGYDRDLKMLLQWLQRRSDMITIGSRDWQDMLDGQQRIALAVERLADATEKIAAAVEEQSKIAGVTKDVLKNTADLAAAIPKS